MKNSFLILLFIFFNFSVLGQNEDESIKYLILEDVFKTFEIKQFEEQTVFETTVWEKHATIPVDNCHLVQVDDQIYAMAFEIFLADDPDDYERMIKTGIMNLFEGEGFKGGDQRLVQVIFYDAANNKFLGKGNGFPLKGYPWTQDNIGSWSDPTLIIDFSYSYKSTHTCILTIYDSLENLEGMGGRHYFFKYHNGKVLTSSGIDGCIDSVYEKNNSLIVKVITNCDAFQFEDEAKKINEVVLFKW